MYSPGGISSRALMIAGNLLGWLAALALIYRLPAADRRE
jgi:hypothetical protein